MSAYCCSWRGMGRAADFGLRFLSLRCFFVLNAVPFSVRGEQRP